MRQRLLQQRAILESHAKLGFEPVVVTACHEFELRWVT